MRDNIVHNQVLSCFSLLPYCPALFFASQKEPSCLYPAHLSPDPHQTAFPSCSTCRPLLHLHTTSSWLLVWLIPIYLSSFRSESPTPGSYLSLPSTPFLAGLGTLASWHPEQYNFVSFLHMKIGSFILEPSESRTAHAL